MKQLARSSLVTLVLLVALAECNDGYLRGSVAPSQDGKTYLAVVEDNGAGCGPIIVHGKLWPYKVGESGPISPGRHKIECGGWIEFDIPQGVVFSFDYWGP